MHTTPLEAGAAARQPSARPTQTSGVISGDLAPAHPRWRQTRSRGSAHGKHVPGGSRRGGGAFWCRHWQRGRGGPGGGRGTVSAWRGVHPGARARVCGVGGQQQAQHWHRAWACACVLAGACQPDALPGACARVHSPCTRPPPSPPPDATPQSNDIDTAITLFAGVLEVRVKHFGGMCVPRARASPAASHERERVRPPPPPPPPLAGCRAGTRVRVSLLSLRLVAAVPGAQTADAGGAGTCT